MATFENIFDGGADTTAVTLANSGGPSGDPVDVVTAAGGAVTYSATQSHPPASLSAKCVTTSTAASAANIRWALAAAAAELWARFYVFLPTSGGTPGQTDTLFRVDSAADAHLMDVRLDTTRHLQIFNAAGTSVGTTTNTVPLNQWVRVEVHATFPGSASAVCDVRLYTTADSDTITETKSVTAQNFASTAAGKVRYGMAAAPGTGSNFTAYLEAVAAGTAGWLGQYGTGSLTSLSSLIVHRPGPTAPDTITPIIPVGSGADPPDGRDYTITGPTGTAARFDGTYTVIAVAYLWSSPSTARDVTVAVKQYPYSGGSATTWTLTRNLTPSSDVSNGITVLGEVTLPLSDVADDNSEHYYAVCVTSGQAGDRFYDVVLIDVAGATVLISSGTTSWKNYYIDEPDITRDLGHILGSGTDRGRAESVMPSAVAVSGGPLTADPGDNWLMVYSAQGTPGLTASYFPRFRVDRA